MRDLAIAARIGSPHTSYSVVKKFINSLFMNVGECDWCLFISLGNINPKIITYINNLANTQPSKVKIFQNGNFYWSEFINEAIKASHDFKWFIKSHDDIELQTPNFFNKIDKGIKESQHIGWISFTDTGFYNGFWAPPSRPGYHIDFYDESSWENKTMFQYHTLSIGWEKGNLLKRAKRFLIQENMELISRAELDFPSGPVRCHAPWNMFVMIKMNTLRDIGKCESWRTYNALFVDEDWGISASVKGYTNIYIPNIDYYHYRPNIIIGGNRSQSQAKIDDYRVKELFKKKWGFFPNPGKKGLSALPKSLLWSANRRSYDWDYNIL